MLYNLPNGKVIEISVEQYLDMSDEEFEYLLSINYGEAIEDPFFGSILESRMSKSDEEDYRHMQLVAHLDVGAPVTA